MSRPGRKRGSHSLAAPSLRTGAAGAPCCRCGVECTPLAPARVRRKLVTDAQEAAGRGFFHTDGGLPRLFARARALIDVFAGKGSTWHAASRSSPYCRYSARICTRRRASIILSSTSSVKRIEESSRSSRAYAPLSFPIWLCCAMRICESCITRKGAHHAT